MRKKPKPVKTKKSASQDFKPEGYVFGRPTKYRKEFCLMLIKHMSKGFSFESFGAVIDTHKQALYEWAEKHDDFSNAKLLATEKCRLFWENAGQTGMYLKEFKSPVWRLNMANRFGWAEKQITEHKGGISLGEKYETLTDEELEKKLREES